MSLKFVCNLEKKFTGTRLRQGISLHSWLIVGAFPRHIGQGERVSAIHRSFMTRWSHSSQVSRLATYIVEAGHSVSDKTIVKDTQTSGRSIWFDSPFESRQENICVFNSIL